MSKWIVMSLFTLVSTQALAFNDTVCNVKVDGKVLMKNRSVEFDTDIANTEAVRIHLRGPTENSDLIGMTAYIQDPAAPGSAEEGKVRVILGQVEFHYMGSKAKISSKYPTLNTKRVHVIEAECANSYGD